MNSSVSRFSSTAPQFGSVLQSLHRAQRWFSSNNGIPLSSRYSRRIRSDLSRIQKVFPSSTSSRSYVNLTAPSLRSFEPHPALSENDYVPKSSFAAALTTARALEAQFSSSLESFKAHIVPGKNFNFQKTLAAAEEMVSCLKVSAFPTHETNLLAAVSIFSPEFDRLSVRQKMGVLQLQIADLQDSLFSFSNTDKDNKSSSSEDNGSNSSSNGTPKEPKQDKDAEKEKEEEKEKEKKQPIAQVDVKTQAEIDAESVVEAEIAKANAKKSADATKAPTNSVDDGVNNKPKSSPAYLNFLKNVQNKQNDESNLKPLETNKSDKDSNNSNSDMPLKSPLSPTQLILLGFLTAFFLTTALFLNQRLPVHNTDDFIQFVLPFVDFLELRQVVLSRSENVHKVEALLRFPTAAAADKFKELLNELVEVSMKQPQLYEVKRIEIQQKMRELANEIQDQDRASGLHRVLVSFETNHEEFLRDLTAFENANGIPEEQRIRHMYHVSQSYIGHILTLGLIGLIGYSLFRRGGTGSNMFNIGKTNFKIDPKDNKIRFKDVAGMDEAKFEVMEFVSFLKDFEKYRRLGARIPKGALLIGPPGTGKTLLAKAIAGESGVSFFSLAGSDFLEMFVGVGASRVRDLFSQARKSTPSIIFIDEIDAIGRERAKKGSTGSNEERENTLNQILVEMDGFSSNENVIVLAGTNRIDILDKALLRPGRFDRQILVDRPDLRGRREILKVHLAPLKLGDDLDDVATRVAALTPGMVGADLANVCNEAAIHAARFDKEHVELIDFEKAVDRVLAGFEKRNSVISETEKKTVAYHESGHAVIGWFLEHADPLLKVTIVPRSGGSLGFAQYLPNETGLVETQALRDRICMALGGRASEELNFGRISTGASDDIKRTTVMARTMVETYGMSPRLFNFSSSGLSEGYSFSRGYSESTAEIIDTEAFKIIEEEYVRAKAILEERKDVVVALSQALLEKETLNHDDIVAILGPRPYETDSYVKYVEQYKAIKEQVKKDEEKKQAEESKSASQPDSSSEPTTEKPSKD